MNSALRKKLIQLAETYETCTFPDDDPSCILCRYHSVTDTEIAAFIMALLSFGRRDLFMKKTEIIFEAAGNHPARWIKSGAWKKDFPAGEKKFYRFYSYDDMRDVFAALQKILEANTSFGLHIKKQYEQELKNRTALCADKTSVQSSVDLAPIIARSFQGCRTVSHTKQSANKRINMFLRWMVRTNSPVDLGLWTWYSPADLIIPLDTHVLQQAEQLGIIPAGCPGNARTAALITAELRKVWPDDPCKGDFALFGAGINTK